MNDFLHQLRTGNIRRFNQKRKYYDSNQQSTYNRNGGNNTYDRKNGNEIKPESEPDFLPQNETLTAIKDLLQHVVENQKFMLEFEGKKAGALESIAASLRLLLAPGEAIAETESSEPKHEEIEVSVDENQKNVIEIINKMRAEKATYSQIAQFLENEHIPTFSRKGSWNAQSVRRYATRTE